MPPHLAQAERDGTGLVWAQCRNSESPLYRFDGKTWNAQPLDLGRQMYPAAMGHLANGAVIALWRGEAESITLSRHLGKESGVVARGTFRIQGNFNGTMLGASDGRLWLTADNPEILRLEPNGNLEVAYTVRPDDVANEKYARTLSTMAAVEDGSGRIWVWSANLDTNRGNLKGVLIFDGTTVHRQETFEGMEGSLISALARKDERFLWAASPQQGLFVLNGETFAATRVPPPDEKSFTNILDIVPVGNDLYVIAVDRPSSVLWRLRGGRWEKLIKRLDDNRYTRRMFIPAAGGVVVNAKPYPWFVGQTGEPVRMDWTNGLSGEALDTFLPFPDQRYLLIGRDQYFGPLTLPPEPPNPHRTRELDLAGNWTTTPDGHVWMVEQKNLDVLREWTGLVWKEHALPAEMKYKEIEPLEGDEEGRLWFVPRDPEKPLTIFDSTKGEWRQFPHIWDALLAMKDKPPKFMKEIKRLSRQRTFEPAFQGRKILYRNSNGRVNYYDGEEWRKWLGTEITGARYAQIEAPFFDTEGRPTVNIKDGIWTYAEAKWIQTGTNPKYAEEKSRANQPAPVELPDGGKADSPWSAFRDSRGVYWFLSGRKLYKAMPGRKVKVFDDDEPNPFTSERLLDGLFVDPHGNAFFRTTSHGTSWFMVPPRGGQPPRTAIRLRQMEIDSVEAEVDVESEGPSESRWRLNDEPWQPLTEKKIRLEALPLGTHTLRVESYDEELRDDPAPAVAGFEIKGLPQDQIQKLIQKLSDADYAQREAAVRALARQPEATLPVLRKARGQAADEEKWWIEAAIQATESRAARKAKP